MGHGLLARLLIICASQLPACKTVDDKRVCTRKVLRTEPGTRQALCELNCLYDYMLVPFKVPPPSLCPSAETVFIPVVFCLHVSEHSWYFFPLFFAWKTPIHPPKLILDTSSCIKSSSVDTPNPPGSLSVTALEYCEVLTVCLPASEKDF